MKKIIKKIGNWIAGLGNSLDNNRLSDSLKDFEELEPVKYMKSLEYATIYDDNRLSIEFLRKEASAYWKLKKYMEKLDVEDEFLDQVFEVANLSPKQTWKQSYEKGEIHWQTALMSFEEPDFMYRIKLIEEQLFRKRWRLGRSA